MLKESFPLVRDFLRRARGADRHLALTLALAAAAAACIKSVSPNAPRALVPPFSRFMHASYVARALTSAGPAAEAYGRSGEIKVRFALPDAELEYPLEVSGEPGAIRYQWTRIADGQLADSSRALEGARVIAPSTPGFYKLSLLQGGETRAMPEITLAVMVPFHDKTGGSIDGYRIGWYKGEGSDAPDEAPPAGFVRISAGDADMQLTTHLRVGDFLVHDEQQEWPRYAAVNERLLDKLELVLAEVTKWQGQTGRPLVSLDVHSGFRSPEHNRTVRRAARDSRHQYGDAADVAIDADGDGRYTARDAKLVELAVDQVEMRYPELAGGVGVYTSRAYHTPYVHIDARGKRARWRG